MYSYLKRIDERLSAGDRRQLADIYAPMPVAVPDEEPWDHLCVTSDGRIRFYGEYGKGSVFEHGIPCYLESCDGGLSWKRQFPDGGSLGASTYIPFLDRYMAIREEAEGVFALTGESPDDAHPRRRRICGRECFEFRQILPLEDRRRILVTAHEHRDQPVCSSAYFPVVFYSDDGGESWTCVHLGAAPWHEPRWPHKGFRWQQNNREHTIAPLSDGTLLMLSRTATDYHYQSFSRDGGESWSEFVPSVFHATGTMPTLKRLSDGRLLLFWCNTRPLPEQDKSAAFPPLGQDMATGVWEDVFTNRDVNHCAVSDDDGKSWQGFRELCLNPIRNASDFRSFGGPELSRDKSVHQFEALELPMGKMLVAYGQNAPCRRIAIFDLDWLYETCRSEDFIHGLAALSTYTYVKSVSGGYRGGPSNPLAFSGHCAWNRTHGALLLPNPEGDGGEALHICRTDDERLYSNLGGAVWNFPAAAGGRVTVRLHIGGKGLRLSLLDCWMNPCDDTVSYYANFSTVVQGSMLSGQDFYTDLTLSFDCDAATVSIDAGEYLHLVRRMEVRPPNGLCYLHLQSAATEKDMEGTYIRSLQFVSERT